jgi:hypothetical protein
MDSLQSADNSRFANPPIGVMSGNGADMIASLASTLRTGSEKAQLQAVQELAALGEAGYRALIDFLLERRPVLLGGPEAISRLESASEPAFTGVPPGLVAGKVYQVLFQSNSESAIEFLQIQFPDGIVPLRSENGIDYAPLQKLLAQQYFQAADQMTLHKLCELAGVQAVQRKWLYFTEVEQFPIADLRTINALWLVHSEGRFGFSVQRELWLSVGKNWDKLWEKISWKSGNNWTRYPEEFTWDLTAPKGHLPLSNQLRGVRAIASLLAHPAWTATISYQ